MRILIILFLLWSLAIFNAQTTPTFPSIESANQYVKENYLKNDRTQFALEYHIQDLSKVKVLKQWQSDGQTVTASFLAYSSVEIHSLFPYKNPKPSDRCHVMLLLETPKEADGAYYQVPVDVIYSRLKNGVLTNNWEFFACRLIGYPTQIGGKEFTKESKIQCLVDAMNRTQIVNQEAILILNNSSSIDLQELRNFYTIDSVEISYENRKSVSEYEINFLVHGEGYYNFIDEKFEENITICKRTLEINTKLSKDGSGWTVTSLYFAQGHSDSPILREDKTFWGNINQVGFQGIFQTKTPFNSPFYAAFNIEKFETDLKTVFVKIFEDPEKNAFMLDQFFDENAPSSVEERAYLINLIKDLKSKRLELYTVNGEPKINFYENIEVEFSQDKFGVVKLRLRCFRNSHYNDSSKQLKKEYKEAGMSEQVLKEGGAFDQELFLDFKCHVVDNYLYLTKVNRDLVANFVVPF
ncbi:MAG: hypothetical protein H6600_10330 [Flavobacteriales bacterium]|nr:hypothetical protein [Flavobacteriales bacterium]